MKRYLFIAMAFALLFPESAQSQNGLAQTPPMGWNSWNWFGKHTIDEEAVMEVIDAMVATGLRDAGYEYVVVDGGWRDTTLNPAGGLRSNPARFPHGMKQLATYAHAKGLKFGLHTTPGTHDCGMDYVGGYGHEDVHIKQFVNWGVDFIKLDRCKFEAGWTEELTREVYVKWSKMLKESGREILLSASAYKYRDWNPEVAHMSRTTGDIRGNKGIAQTAMFDGPKGSVMAIADINNQHAEFARPGYWNDPDMMVVGRHGMTVEEQKIHFALWCVMSSPLMLGNDPRFMTQEELDIIMNKDCIEINQDPTEQGRRILKDGNSEIWVKKLKDGRVGALLINRGPEASENLSFNFSDIGKSGKVKLKDVYAKKTIGPFKDTFTAKLEPRTGLFLIVQ